MEKLRANGAALKVAGDGRHDSMGHSAKYCGYSIYSCADSVVIHFELVQVSSRSFAIGQKS